MKKIVVMMAILIGLGSALAPSAQAEPTKKEIAQAEKTAKKRTKELTKQGWKLQGSSTLEIKLNKHLLRTTDFGGTATEYVASSEDNVDIDMGITEATNNAAQYYAQNSGSIVKGRIDSQKDKISDQQSKAFVAAFEQLILKEIKGEFQRSFVLTKEKKGKNPTYDVQVFYLLDEDAASQARIRAMKQAAEEARIAEELGDQISDFINKGFENN